MEIRMGPSQCEYLVTGMYCVIPTAMNMRKPWMSEWILQVLDYKKNLEVLNYFLHILQISTSIYNGKDYLAKL